MKLHQSASRFISVYTLCLLSFAGHAQSKETLAKLKASPPVFITLPDDYGTMYPDTNILEWDKSYDAFNSLMTPAVAKTQMGMSYKLDSVNIWWCMPSARPHVQLDTSTRITDLSAIVGDWRVVSDRTILYIDSAVYLTKRIYRSQKTTEHNEDDVLFSVSEKKCAFYIKKGGKSHYKNMGSSRYAIENGRYLLRYSILKSGGGISLIGLKDDRLIVTYYIVEERKIINKYITYQAIAQQMVFERFN